MSDTVVVSRATRRKLPRGFEFHWGKGQVVEEASVKCRIGSHDSWEPTVQLLRYEDGSEMLRFCVFHGTRMSRMWPLMEEEVLSALSSEVKDCPGIRRMLGLMMGS